MAVILGLFLLISVCTIYISALDRRITADHDSIDAYTSLLEELERAPDILGDKALLYVTRGGMDYPEQYAQMWAAAEQDLSEVQALLAGHQERQVVSYLESLQSCWESRRVQECSAVLMAAADRGEDLSEWPIFDQYGRQEEGTALSLLEEESYRSAGTEMAQSAGRLWSYLVSVAKADETKAADRRQFFQKTLWVMNGAILLVLGGMCVMLLRELLLPLKKAIQKVQKGEPLSELEGMLELRQLSCNYNRLLRARNAMEGNLRSLSLTDALTNLPNRLAFENYTAQLRAERPEVSLTVFSLDVNGLKQVNDTLGHVYGDELLRKASACILETFSDGSGKNCFRFGGDEFAAFWQDTPFSEIEKTLERFEHAQASRGVSIAVGYAYARRLDSASVDALYHQADEEMYRRKMAHKLAMQEKKTE